MVRAMPVSPRYKAKPLILELGDHFYDRVRPADFPKAIPRYINLEAAATVGLDTLTANEWQSHFHAFAKLPENLETPLALRYHGHQFRSYNDRLGDGRGFLAAQLEDSRGRTLDLGTKGSGKTPWSRGGDGRLTLKGAVREALATEMLESLGVNTSKTFCVFETGEELERNDEPSPTRAAVLTRLGHSHIRFGTFQRQAGLQEKAALQKLVDYTIHNYYPQIEKLEPSKRTAELLNQVSVKTAHLCASWMIAGFVHGVLNTDNMNINGESFDYGPYRFMPTYDPEFTAAYFDESGLYAYGRQPEAVIWNLEQLATCFLYLETEAAKDGEPARDQREELVNALRGFTPVFNDAAAKLMIERLGLSLTHERALEHGEDLLLAVFNFLAQSQIPFEQFFFDWYGGDKSRALRSPVKDLYVGEQIEAFTKVIDGWPAPDAVVSALEVNSYFKREKPSTLLIDEIEAIWDPIAQSDDWSKFNDKIDEIREMGRAHGRR